MLVRFFPRWVALLCLLFTLPLLSPLWSVLTPLLGSLIGYAEVPQVSTGSGDTLYRYVSLLAAVLVSLPIALFWSLRSAEPSTGLSRWFHWYLRYYLGFAMISYGLSKIWRQQFSEIPLEWMAMPLGDASPMGLVWRMMGYSAAYSFVAGLAELIGGVMLFSRRLTPLGALLLLPVMGNVVLLNLCFDIPVKLGAITYFLGALYLSTPAQRALLSIARGQRYEPTPLQALFEVDWKNKISGIARYAALLIYIAGMSYNIIEIKSQNTSPKQELYGIYHVTEEHSPWRQLVFGEASTVTIQAKDLSTEFFLVEYLGDGRLRLSNAKREMQLSYQISPDQTMTLTGAQAHVILKRHPVRLSERGFHWVNEFPYNY